MSIKNNYYVYEHRRKDTGDVFYVGKGRNGRAKCKHNRNSYWGRVCAKAGGFTVAYKVSNVDEELALLVEVELIDAYRRRGFKITNITNGGDGAPGWVPSEETRRKIGEANKHTPKASGESHGMFGKKHKPETLAKMSAAKKGKYTGELHPFYNKKHTPETLAKISESRKGKCVGAENPFYGKKHTEESLKKVVAPHIGRKHSDEERAKRKVAVLASVPTWESTRPVRCLTTGQVYFGLNEAARCLSLHRQSIRMVCNGKLKQTGGYFFEWVVK